MIFFLYKLDKLTGSVNGTALFCCMFVLYVAMIFLLSKNLISYLILHLIYQCVLPNGYPLLLVEFLKNDVLVRWDCEFVHHCCFLLFR